MTSVSESVKQMVYMDAPPADHHEKKNKDDFANILKIKQTVQRMRNPFDSAHQRDELMNLYSGQISAATNLSDAKHLGLEALAAAEESNAEKIIPPKIETFANQIKHSKKRQDNVKQVMSEESAVTRALCFTQDLSHEARIEAFSYEWLDYPPSLFDKLDKNQFAMREGCKASYLKALQDEISESWEPSKELPMSVSNTVYVVDAMAFLQPFNTLGARTVSQLQKMYKGKLLGMKPMNCTEIHFIHDRYDFDMKSLKGDERQRRRMSNITRVCAS